MVDLSETKVFDVEFEYLYIKKLNYKGITTIN